MARSIYDHYVYSTSPDFAALIMTGYIKTVLAVNPEDRWKKYTGRVLLHATGMPDTDEAKETLKTLEMENLISANSIMARMTVAKIKQYDDASWQADYEKHGYEMPFARFCASQNITGKEVWGMEFGEVESLIEPVFDVLLDSEGRSFFWLATDPLRMEAVKLALGRENVVSLVEG